MAWITTPTHSRDWTNELIARVENGYLTWEMIARAALCYLSEDDVEDMARSNDFLDDPDAEDEDQFPKSMHLDMIQSSNH